MDWPVSVELFYLMRTSVAALRRRLTGRTGSHSKCVGRSVPVMRRMILLSCTSTRSVCHDWNILVCNTPRLNSRGLTQKNGVWQRLYTMNNLSIWRGYCFCSSALQQSCSRGVCRIVSNPVQHQDRSDGDHELVAVCSN